ncbi:signal recognition particle-docking protein FtsY [Photobacterium halotolerans]|uniref:signal recognition particle-docking protein FtsY n=1 Tax=Photobacterium halotolerans TaxID=265726 RepID=UPI001372B9D9|nr:signal recognition particle-docking protein FtsY [Photobacterium halotolerans]NAW88100.1 signal recognition particle-docking protein FtsY [Photobacterium halotolerans]
MAEKKKRGLFSWLGFGEEEQTEQKEQHKPQEEAVEPEQAQDAVSETQTQSAATEDSVPPHQDMAEAEAPLTHRDTEPELPEQSAHLDVEADTQTRPAEEELPPHSQQVAAEPVSVSEEPAVQEKPQREGFFARLMKGLKKTRNNLGAGFFGLFRGKQIDDDLFEELEEQLLVADVGMDTTLKIIENLTEKADRKQLKDGEALYGLLKDELSEMLAKVEQPLVIDTSRKPYVILMVGVNGVGKTTTIGKLAKQFQQQGLSVMLAAGDTFRAAAVEQLQVWGDRNNVPVVAQHTGADSASVIYDAIESAKARNVDVVIADTAGRLQNKGNLMEELRKIVRVMQKIDPLAPHEIMLTVDAGTGQNAISQAKLFSEVAPVSGITLTKLDGTAKGGVIFAIADQFNIPIRYIGIGEGIEDLRPFAAQEFIEALFSDED